MPPGAPGTSWWEAAALLALAWWPASLPACLLLAWLGHRARGRLPGAGLLLLAGMGALILLLAAFDTGLRGVSPLPS